MMLRTRLLWFTLGFSVTGASISNFVCRDLYADRLSLASDMNEKFDTLETRVSAVESVASNNSTLSQAEG